MISRCVIGITDWLISSEAIEEEDRALYEYAVHSLMLSLAPVVLVMMIGATLGAVKEGLVLIVPFMTIRKFSGGYHAKREMNCLAASGVSLTACVWLAVHAEGSLVLSLLTLIAAISLSVFSPIDSENRRLDDEEIKRYRLITRMIALFFAGLYILLLALGADTYAVCIAIGLILSAGLQVPCIVKKMLKIE